MGTSRHPTLPPPRGLAEMVAHLRTQTPDDALHAHHRAIVARLSQLADAVSGLDRIAMTPDPAQTKAAHALRIKTAAKSLEAKANSIAEMVGGSVRSATIDLDAAIDNIAGLKADSYAAEVRQAVRAMPQKERDATLLRAVESGQASVVAALTDAPDVVTGFSGDLSSRMRDQFRKTHAKEPYEALTRLHDLYSSSSVLIESAKRITREVTNERYLAEIHAAQEASRAASEAFQGSLAD